MRNGGKAAAEPAFSLIKHKNWRAFTAIFAWRAAPVHEFFDAVPMKCLWPAKEKWRLSFAPMRAKQGTTRKPECLRLRSPAYAMRAREAAKADDHFS